MLPANEFAVGGDRMLFLRRALWITLGVSIVALLALPLKLQVLSACALLALDLLHLVTAIAFLVWFRRAHANLAALRIPTRHGSNAAIAFFFIPVANLILPPFVVADVWSGSAPTVRLRRDRRVRSEVTMWWSTYVIASAVYGAGRYLGGGPLLPFGCIAGVVAIGMTIRLVDEIERRQRVLAQQAIDPAQEAASQRAASWKDYLFPVGSAFDDE